MVKDRDVAIGSLAGLVPIALAVNPGTGASDVEQWEMTWPAWLDRAELVGAQVYGTAVTATISFDVKIAGVTALASAVTPTANTPVLATLATTRSARRIKAGQALTVHATTNGSGNIVNGRIILFFRGYPAATE